MVTICAWCRFTVAAPRCGADEPVVNYGMCPACRDEQLSHAVDASATDAIDERHATA